MQYVGNALYIGDSNEIQGLALTAAPEAVEAFIVHAHEEIEEPWVKVVGRFLEPHQESEAGWVGAFIPRDPAEMPEGDQTGAPMHLGIWDERHAAEVVQQIEFQGGGRMYVLHAAGESA